MVKKMRLLFTHLLMNVIIFFLSFVIESTKEQYQQTTHLKGNDVNSLVVYGKTGIFNTENTIGAIYMTKSFLIENETEIIFFGGSRLVNTYEIWRIFSDEAWKFSLEKKEWKFVKGRKSGTVRHKVNTQNIWTEESEIGSISAAEGWMDEDGIINIFGGVSYPKVSDYVYACNTNDFWRFNVTSNLYNNFFYSIYFTTSYQGGTYEKYTNIYPVSKEFNIYDLENHPSGRHGHGIVRNQNQVLVIGGYGYLETKEIDTLSDWWIFSIEKMQWKLAGGSISDVNYPIFGTTNIYHQNNTFGQRYKSNPILINDEEALIFAGSQTDAFHFNTVQKYNFTSNMIKYISGCKDPYNLDLTFAKGGYQREFSTENIPGGRRGNQIYRISEDELLVFGGWGNTASSSGFLNDFWIFSIKKGQWKFNGREITKYPSHDCTITDNSNEYSDSTMIGSMENFQGHYLQSTNELIIATGYGFRKYRGYLDDVWSIYLGNMCNSIKDTDPNVCSKIGSCIGHNQCLCPEGLFGYCNLKKCFGILSNSSEVCSGNGICIDEKCACFDSSAYTNNDCSIDQNLKSFMENLWLIIGLPIGIIVAVFFFIVIGIILCIVLIKLGKILKKIDGIEDIDLILDEAKLEQSKKDTPKIQIDKSLFEINYKDIQLLSILGEGGSNSVCYLCKWQDNFCAYKGFTIHQTSDTSEFQNLYEEFEREVQIYSSINHPSILQFYGACVNPPKVGILVEFAKNGDLNAFLHSFRYSNKKNYSKRGKLRLIREIASGMSYLHSIDVLHRDLKPENVLIDKNEHAKIMDFGLSKLRSPNEEKTMTKRIGTSYYMAPEVFTINGKKYDEKCDVYSWSILAYVVITENFFPYGAKSNQSSILQKVSKNPNFRPKISKNDFRGCEFVEEIIKRNWNSDPTKRDSFDEIVTILSKQKKVYEEKEEKEEKKVVKKPSSLQSKELKYLKSLFIEQELELERKIKKI